LIKTGTHKGHPYVVVFDNIQVFVGASLVGALNLMEVITKSLKKESSHALITNKAI